MAGRRFLGPALAGLSMDWLPHDLPVFAALADLAFTVYAATSRSASALTLPPFETRR